MKVEIVNLIEMLEEIINNGGKVPFSNKITVDKDEVLSVLNEMHNRLPSDIRLAISIVEDKQKIIMQAQKEANQIIAKAEEQRDMMIEEHQITKMATEQANEMIDQTTKKTKEMNAASKDYVDSMLGEFQEYLKDKISELEENRRSLK